MEAKKVFLRAMQVCMVLAMFSVFYACSEENVTPEPEPPTEEPVPAGDDGEVGFSITNENTGSSTEGGSSGEGGSTGEGSGTGTTPEDPAVATAEESVDMTISATSSYKDPNGTTYTCEPKATITLSADLDTVYAKDIETLTKVIGNPKVTNGNTGTNPVNYTTDQIFNIGGQNVTFNLGYEVYTHTNSENQKIEMPYVKVNNANFGASTPTETKDVKSRGTETQAVRLANISVVPAKKVMSRSISVTDTTTYEVTARFNLDVESKNSANDQKQTLSFEVKYFAVISETTEYDGAKLTCEVQSSIQPQNGVYVVNDPQNPLEILVKQESSFMGTDGVTQTGSATTKITAVAPGDVYFANKDAIADKVQELTAISVDEQNLTSPLPYYDFEDVKFEGYDIKSSSVSDTLETYHVVAKYSQVAKPVNVETATDKPAELKFAYQVEFIAKVKIEPVTLKDVKYRQEYEWLPPHDNIPWRYRFIVYRDRIYSNGETVTDTYTTVNRIVEYGIHVDGSDGWNAKKSWEKDDHMDPNATDTLSYSVFGYIDVDADISKITETELRDPLEDGYSDDFNTYENDVSGKYFSDSKTDGGWYYDRAGYYRSFYIFYEGVVRLNSYPAILTYNYFLYLDGKQFVCDRVDLSSCKSECILEDAESDFRGKVKVLKHKFGIDWLGKHCRVELTDTIF